MPAPSIGTYIKPVSLRVYGYCLEVMKVVAYEGWAGDSVEQWQYKRWGMKDGQPFDDGHVRTGGCISGVNCIRPGVWRSWSQECDGSPMYWRKIETLGQQDLFI